MRGLTPSTPRPSHEAVPSPLAIHVGAASGKLEAEVKEIVHGVCVVAEDTDGDGDGGGVSGEVVGTSVGMRCATTVMAFSGMSRNESIRYLKMVS
jgi:hypothetical protein